MLDYIVTSKRDPDFTAPLYIIPTSINYDRVLEDRNLTEELLGREDRSTRMQKLRTTSQFLFKNFFRSLVRRFKRYGYAIVTFGTPVSVDQFVKEHPRVLSNAFEDRKADLQRLADQVMREISSAIPVTPVTLLARVFADHAKSSEVAEQVIVADIERYKREWTGRVWLMREKSASDIWRAGREILLLRYLIEVVVGGWRWNPDELLIRDYYANSLLTFDEVQRRGWPERGIREEAAASAPPLATPAVRN
jgi:glycerol-3-phosphate O-acyltransferase